MSAVGAGVGTAVVAIVAVRKIEEPLRDWIFTNRSISNETG